MNHRPRPQLLFAGTPKSALRRASGSSLDSLWLDSAAPAAPSSSVLSVLRDLMVASVGEDGQLSRTLQEEASKLRPLLALLESKS